MRFPWSIHLLMFLSFETLTSIIRTGLPILVKLISLVNSVIIFLSQMTLLKWLTFLWGSQTVIFIVLFWWIANSVLSKGKPAILPLFNGPEVLSSPSDKAKLFTENFSKNSNIDESLPVFPSGANLKVHNIFATSKMIKKVIMNLDLPKASDLDCILVVVLKTVSWNFLTY